MNIEMEEITTDNLARMANAQPRCLADLFFNGEVDPITATFGAEILGNSCEDTSIVIHGCRNLLNHEKAYVREGALLGLAGHIGDKRAQALVKRLSEEDESKILRDFAEEILEGV